MRSDQKQRREFTLELKLTNNFGMHRSQEACRKFTGYWIASLRFYFTGFTLASEPGLHQNGPALGCVGHTSAERNSPGDVTTIFRPS